MPAIKICGLTTEQEIQYINTVHAEYAGFVLFFPKSKRNLSVDEACRLRLKLNPDILAVAVVVSPTVKQILQIEANGFDILQVHGELRPEVLNSCKLPIFRAIHFSGSWQNVEEHDHIQCYLFDGQRAGSGQTFDWSQIKRTDTYGKPFALAGGLHPNNVQEAIRITSPDIVDVSSGVEGADGKKSFEKIQAFVTAVRCYNKGKVE